MDKIHKELLTKTNKLLFKCNRCLEKNISFTRHFCNNDYCTERICKQCYEKDGYKYCMDCSKFNISFLDVIFVFFLFIFSFIVIFILVFNGLFKYCIIIYLTIIFVGWIRNT